MPRLNVERIAKAWAIYLQSQNESQVATELNMSRETVRKLVNEGHAPTNTRPFKEQYQEYLRTVENRITETALESPVKLGIGLTRALQILRDKAIKAVEQLEDVPIPATTDPIGQMIVVTRWMKEWVELVKELQELTGTKPDRTVDETGHDPNDGADIRNWSDAELEAYRLHGIWPHGRPLPK